MIMAVEKYTVINLDIESNENVINSSNFLKRLLL